MNVPTRPLPVPPTPATGASLRIGALAHIEVYDDLPAVQASWHQLACHGIPPSPYQRYEWAFLWQRHVGERQRAVPFVVVGSNAAGTPLFLWPLVRMQSGSLTSVRFFGGKHANINVALWNREFAENLNASDMGALLTEVATARSGIDLFVLTNQPARWEGMANPFLLLPHQHAPDDLFQLALHGDADNDGVNNLLTGSARLRAKERKLEKLDGYRYIRTTAGPDVDRQLNAFLIQKAAHLSANGLANVFAEPGVEAFLRAACHHDLAADRPAIEIHALEAAGELLALFAGVSDGRRYSSMFNSYTLGENARHSPGLVLLAHLVASCAERKLGVFDLGVGEARYKRTFCNDVLPLYDSYWPVTMRGRMAADTGRLIAAVKRLIKSTPTVWNVIQIARRRLASRNVNDA